MPENERSQDTHIMLQQLDRGFMGNRWLQRDKNGEVIGHFANPQSYATEEVPPDHPDILAWNAKYEQMRTSGTYSALSDRLKALEETLARIEKRLTAGG